MNKLTEVSVKNGYKAACSHYRKLVYPLFLTLLVLLLTSPVQAKYSGGTGEPNKPYQIDDANDMNEIGTHPEDWGSHFILVNDINLAKYTGTEFSIIGTYPSDPFTGVFDGNDHKILNFTYEGTSLFSVGLFSHIVYGEIRNLSLISPRISIPDGRYVGALVGIMEGGVLKQCRIVDGHIAAFEPIGGLVSRSWDNVLITDCSAEATIIAEEWGDQIGILIGWHNDGTIARCHSSGYVQGRISIGGLVGNMDSGSIYDCFSIADCNGDQDVGVLTGSHSDSEMEHCYTNGTVMGQDYVGGLIGNSLRCNYLKCYWDTNMNPDVNGIGNTTDPNVIGKTTAEMMQEATFTNWDFVEVWGIGEEQTYPFLKLYPAGDLNHDRRVNFMDFAIFVDHWLEGVE